MRRPYEGLVGTYRRVTRVLPQSSFSSGARRPSESLTVDHLLLANLDVPTVRELLKGYGVAPTATPERMSGGLLSHS